MVGLHLNLFFICTNQHLKNNEGEHVLTKCLLKKHAGPSPECFRHTATLVRLCIFLGVVFINAICFKTCPPDGNFLICLLIVSVFSYYCSFQQFLNYLATILSRLFHLFFHFYRLDFYHQQYASSKNHASKVCRADSINQNALTTSIFGLESKAFGITLQFGYKFCCSSFTALYSMPLTVWEKNA